VTSLPPLKIVIAGPVGAGKTTFVRTITESNLVSTEEISTEPLGKLTTTVALDFGCITIADQPVHLFGTPGQERFNFMWNILCEGAAGIILLIAADAPKDFTAARKILECVTSQVPVPFVIGVTRADAPRAWPVEDIAHYFNVHPDIVVSADARTKRDCLNVLLRFFQVSAAHQED
jgi:signal recognition particle receptor subunit beta